MSHEASLIHALDEVLAGKDVVYVCPTEMVARDSFVEAEELLHTRGVEILRIASQCRLKVVGGSTLVAVSDQIDPIRFRGRQVSFVFHPNSGAYISPERSRAWQWISMPRSAG